MRRSYHVRRSTFTHVLPQFSSILPRLGAIVGRLSEFRDVLRDEIKRIFWRDECWRDEQMSLLCVLSPFSATPLPTRHSYSVDLATQLFLSKSTNLERKEK